jgi:hypothetical protein
MLPMCLVHGVATDDQPLADRRFVVPLGHEGEHLPLPRAERAHEVGAATAEQC